MKKNLTVAIALFIKDVTDDGFKLWTQKRLEEGSLFGMNEFPGGKIEPGESPEEACRREVLEEVGVGLNSAVKLVLFKYQDYSYENRNICLFVFLSNFSSLPPLKGDWNQISFSSKSEPLKGKIPPINHVIIDDLAVYIHSQHQARVLDLLWKM